MSKDTFKECVKSTLLIALHICGYAVLLVRERHYLCKLRCTDNVFVIDRPHCIDPIVNAYTRNNHAAIYVVGELHPGKFLMLNSMDLQLNHERG